MKKISRCAAIALVLFSLLSCSKDATDDNARYDEIVSRLDRIENPGIASAGKQIESVRTALPELESLPVEVEAFSKALEEAGDKLQAALDAAVETTAALKEEFDRAREDAEGSEAATREELVRQVETVRADVFAQLDAAAALVESEIALVRKVGQESGALALKLRSDIADTKSYAYSALPDSWEKTTLATLSHARNLAADLAAISATGEGLETSLSYAVSSVSTGISSDIASAMLPISYRFSTDTAVELAGYYATALSAVLTDVQDARNGEFQQKLTFCRNLVPGWINSSLGAFDPIVTADTLLSCSAYSLAESLNSQKTYLEALKDAPDELITTPEEALAHNAEGIETLASGTKKLHGDLSDALSNLFSAYSAALSGAITQNGGRIEGDFAMDVLKANAAATAAVDAASKSGKALETGVEKLRAEVGQVRQSLTRTDFNVLDKKIEAIASKLQSITFVPSYSDGSIPIGYSDYRGPLAPVVCEIMYDIQPVSVAEELSEVWDKALTLKGVYTNITKAAAGEGFSCRITDFSREGGRIFLSFSAEGIDESFLKGEIGASVCLSVSSGGVSKSSSYAPLSPYSIDWLKIPDENFARFLTLSFDSDGDGHITAAEAAEVTEMDMSRFAQFYPVRSLDGIEYFISLEKLDCSGHRITGLDLSYGSSLVEVNCSGNPLEAIDLTGCSGIEKLDVSGTGLQTLVIQDLTNLKTLTADSCKGLSTIDLSKNAALTSLSMKYSGLTGIDLCSNKSLTYFNLFDVPSHSFTVRVESNDWLRGVRSSVGYGAEFHDSADKMFYGGSIEIDGIVWMRYDSTGTDGNECYDIGDKYEWDYDEHCPDGWRLPTRSEYEAVIQNRSGHVRRKTNPDVYGYWLSGSEAYSETTPAVFLSQNPGDTRGHHWCGDNLGGGTAICLYFSLGSLSMEELPRTESHLYRCVKE